MILSFYKPPACAIKGVENNTNKGGQNVMKEVQGMVEYLSITERNSRLSMALIYFIDILANVAFMYASLHPEYTHVPVISEKPHQFFDLFFASSAGALILLDAWLIHAVVLHHKYTRMWALIGFLVVQASVIIVNLINTLLYDGWWDVGYLYVIIGTIMFVVYLRRYLTLKLQEKYARFLQGGKL